ncbi:hypothetical protein [Aeromonas allosaccharophila]|uniref:hypothetical protein n=1 Tax=Aeromonas allosaccharophila TaxID=656 RepID=UPI003B969837
MDAHGFTILYRARSYIPEWQPVQIDVDILLGHKPPWIGASGQHLAVESKRVYICGETAVDPVGEGAEAIPQVDCAARPI